LRSAITRFLSKARIVADSGSSAVMNDAGLSPARPNGSRKSFRVLHRQPTGTIEGKWRACLTDSYFPTHYTAPEYFLEPAFRDKKPFAVLSFAGDDVTAVLTGINERNHVQSGLSVRPQITFSRDADPERALGNLIAGLREEAQSAKLIDLFVWSDIAGLINARFQQRQCEGVVMLDLSRGPDALFRKFSENKRTNIKKAIKFGVFVDAAKNRDDISAYYAICVDWSHRKALPIVGEEEFQETFALTGNRRLWLARFDGKIVAGVVVRYLPGGVMEYAANSSLQSALRLRPNDLLHWRAIEWACAEGMTKYSLGGAHPFLRKFGGEIVPTTRCRLDLSFLGRHALGDWITERAEAARTFLPEQVLTLSRAVRRRLPRLRA
jgi:Acetyltransferase (GNAT) domain